MTDRELRPSAEAPAETSVNTATNGADEAVEPVAASPAPVAPRKSRRRAGSSAPARATDASDARSVAAVVEEAAAPAQRPPRAGISVEVLLYVLILVAAVLTRFWDLGSKALHHDESLHAYYSWVYETGGGYKHHPLMHGPFLFHANALVYLLFGDSDATSRYMPALFGVALVGLPYLLRSPHLLGRWGALSASFLILVSPVLLYQSRYIRHDIYTVTGTLLLFISIVRYWERPQRRWLVIGAATIAFLLTNHEIIFAILAIFGLYLYGALLISRIRAWWPDRRDSVLMLAGVHIGALVLLLVWVAVMPTRYKDEIYDIPWENPTTDQQVEYYKQLFTNLLFLGLIAILVSFVVGLWVVLKFARDPKRRDEGWLPALFGDPEPRTVESGIINAWKDRHGLTVALLVALFIFVTLFTSFYTNLYGLVSSTVATDGTLLYWLGQHDYRRGEQPWFYFLLLFPQYEFIAVTLGVTMAGVTIVRGVGGLFGWWSSGRNLFFRMMLTVWFIGIFLGLSYAGEKMPWLLAHITLPATLLAAVLIGGLVERALAARPEQAETGRRPFLAAAWPEWGLLALLLAAAGCWFALAGRLSYGRFVDASQPGGYTREITSYAADRWWWLTIPIIVALAAVIASALLRGTRRTAMATLAAMTLVLTLLQVNVGWRLSYERPDIPTDMMIYTQTSPDVTRVMGEISQLSYELTGGNGLEIWYDSGVSWPFQWYLRDFPNKRFYGSSLSGPPGNAAVVLVASDRDAQVAPYLTGYTAQEYVLRWWFPEELYRDFALAPELSPGRSAWTSSDQPHGVTDIIGSAFDSIVGTMTPDGQARLFRLLVYRDLEQPLGQYRFKIYVRNDLLPLLNSIRY